MERYYFGLEEQGEAGSVEDFVTALRESAANRKLGGAAEERIRDQFALKSFNDKTKEGVCMKDEPPLDEVVAIA
ncbi:hypothetical protein NDU88_000255 [Pleurodeles waltl]|uniref:Uncharacterized protein n=1 Tax=Pleurodeles waltl TaxID=8319 RepID=A0AAV7P2A1_PLEWA|nr:hypothetical protein NDU88_000255 [Pleurodeles waltl]